MDHRRDDAAAAALARAIRRAVPMRNMEKAAPGLSRLFLVALREDPDGPAALSAALLENGALARALVAAGGTADVAEADALAGRILDALAGPPPTQVP